MHFKLSEFLIELWLSEDQLISAWFWWGLGIVLLIIIATFLLWLTMRQYDTRLSEPSMMVRAFQFFWIFLLQLFQLTLELELCCWRLFCPHNIFFLFRVKRLGLDLKVSEDTSPQMLLRVSLLTDAGFLRTATRVQCHQLETRSRLQGGRTLHQFLSDAFDFDLTWPLAT